MSERESARERERASERQRKKAQTSSGFEPSVQAFQAINLYEGAAAAAAGGNGAGI